MIFLHLPRFNAIFSSTPNSSKSLFTISFQVFLGLPTFFFPYTSIYFNNLNSHPSASLLTVTDQTIETFSVLINPVSFSNQISWPSLHWRSCSAISLLPCISTFCYHNFSSCLQISLSMPISKHHTTKLT